jgi:hypothetical protein
MPNEAQCSVRLRRRLSEFAVSIVGDASADDLGVLGEAASSRTERHVLASNIAC